MEIIKKIIAKIKEGMLKDMLTQTIWIYQYVKKHWKSITIYTLLGLLGTAVSITTSLISKDLVDVITGHQTSALLHTFSLFIGFSIGSIIVTQISSYASSWISMKVDNEIKADVFDKMLITDWESITAYHTGDLLTRWSSDASTISNGILSWIPNLIIYLVRFISTFAVVLYYDPTFALLAMLGIPVSIIMSRTLLSKMQKNNKESAAMNARMSGFNQEAFSNIQTLKAFDMVHHYSHRLKSLQKDYLSMKMDFQKLSTITSIIMSVVGIAISSLCYGWGIYRVWTGAISYGTMTMFLSLSGSLTGTLNNLISLVPTAISITTSAGRLMDILDMPKEDYTDDEHACEMLNQSRQNGVELHLEDINYTYHGGAKVFEHTFMHAAPHEIVALAGPSGEGKTTMLRILLALLVPQKGTCSVSLAHSQFDNTQGSGNASYDLRPNGASLPLSPSTRRLFSYVPQGNTMFSGTIAENMRSVKPDASDAEITQALQLSCAWDFVNNMPDGIYSVIGERGGGLSEGQAQRLSIARALLRKSPILLLDEATSALDVATERQVIRNIMTDEYPRTCILTTHRPSVLSICNRVYGIRNKQCQPLDEEEIRQLVNDF